MEFEETKATAEVSGESPENVKEITRTGFSDGKSAAPEAAKKFYGQISRVVGKAAYGLSYYTGFGAAFAAALAREAMPEKMQDGFSDGAKDGGEAAEKSIHRMRENFANQRESADGERLAEQPMPESV